MRAQAGTLLSSARLVVCCAPEPSERGPSPRLCAVPMSSSRALPSCGVVFPRCPLGCCECNCQLAPWVEQIRSCDAPLSRVNVVLCDSPESWKFDCFALSAHAAPPPMASVRVRHADHPRLAFRCCRCCASLKCARASRPLAPLLLEVLRPQNPPVKQHACPGGSVACARVPSLTLAHQPRDRPRV